MMSHLSQVVRSGTLATWLKRIRFQLPLVLVMAVLLPTIAFYGSDFAALRNSTSGTNAVLGSGLAIVLGVFLARNTTASPGLGAFSAILPSFVTTFGVVLVAFLMLRLDYSRYLFAAAFLISTVLIIGIHLLSARLPTRRLYVVPFGATDSLVQHERALCTALSQPIVPADPSAVLVADLRANLPDDWERLISDMAVAGYPVYHVKQVLESLTGRVEIEHLSENSFGSLIPNRSYLVVKRGLDVVGALVLLPLLLPLFAAIAIWIKIDSPGPAFFRQERRGHRNRPFRVLKFRTMVDRAATMSGSERESAITQAHDLRITRAGWVLRRTRLDELPQLWNVLRGEMSLVGPRPEASALSQWYEQELPYYSYRHIVRPGITGWAQVNQGHVAELDDVHEKLHYDFYYIKNLSFSMDFLVLIRTIRVIVSGFGAK